MDRKELITLAEEIITGNIHGRDIYRNLLDIPDKDTFDILPGADIIRGHYFGREIHLCTICNGKSGRCSEDCGFCSQSAFSKTDAPVYPLMGKEELKQGGLYAYETPVNRFSIVTTGKRLPKEEVKAVADAMAKLDHKRIGKCASLGVLGPDDFQVLKGAGINRYHHNLETAQSFFSKVCTTHKYEERVNTIAAAQRAGLSVCSGGILGMGETDEQILELALSLKELNVDSVPLNFLVPIKGTPMEHAHNITPLRCLKIIALFRYFLPDKEIIICGGREYNLGELHSMIFYAGASGIMTGNYLTTEGRTLQKDLELIEQLGFTVREK
ncbi:MAG: biotin synthase BioB [Deltaproteobacteria bacterium]|nr:biotin synthase BioB [Deltaproteobacteria bacterium]